MYAMIDAEEFVACFFFIVCLVLLNFWLMNIFVAVIINTFGEIREETKHSAFAGKTYVLYTLSEAWLTHQICRHANVLAEDPASQGKKPTRRSFVSHRLFKGLNWAWIGVVVADIGIQASKTSTDSLAKIRWLSRSMPLHLQELDRLTFNGTRSS